jgi:hypothetical protein
VCGFVHGDQTKGQCEQGCRDHPLRDQFLECIFDSPCQVAAMQVCFFDPPGSAAPYLPNPPQPEDPAVPHTGSVPK